MTYTLEGHGITYQLHDPGSHIGRIIRETGRPYELKLLEDAYFRRRPGSLALDVGAHVGNHALWFALVCDMVVHAWEPDPGNVRSLRANVWLNPTADVTVHPVALGESPGWARLVGDPVYGTAVAEYGDGPVEVRTLDSYEFDDVAIVKVDVEGNEHRVLAGGVDTLTRCRPVVWAERGDNTDIAELADVLVPLGYHHVTTYGATPMTVWEPA